VNAEETNGEQAKRTTPGNGGTRNFTSLKQIRS